MKLPFFWQAALFEVLFHRHPGDTVVPDHGKHPYLKFCFHRHQGDTVVPDHGKKDLLKVYRRFHFSSVCRTMSVIAGSTIDRSKEQVKYIATVQGAPEFVRNMASNALDARGRY